MGFFTTISQRAAPLLQFGKIGLPKNNEIIKNAKIQVAPMQNQEQQNKSTVPITSIADLVKHFTVQETKIPHSPNSLLPTITNKHNKSNIVKPIGASVKSLSKSLPDASINRNYGFLDSSPTKVSDAWQWGLQAAINTKSLNQNISIAPSKSIEDLAQNMVLNASHSLLPTITNKHNKSNIVTPIGASVNSLSKSLPAINHAWLGGRRQELHNKWKRGCKALIMQNTFLSRTQKIELNNQKSQKPLLQDATKTTKIHPTGSSEKNDSSHKKM